MTNKLPEIGARYRHKINNKTYVLLGMNIRSYHFYNDEVFTKGVVFNLKAVNQDSYSFNLKDHFWERFEPLPKEQEDKQEKIMQAHAESGKFGNSFADIKKKVEEAKEELKYHANKTNYFCKELGLDKIKESAQKLINALENTSKKDDNLPIKEEPKSIWKPISELPALNLDVLLFRMNNYKQITFGGYIENEESVGYFIDKYKQPISEHLIEEYCTLTDFINQQEQNTKDIAEMKLKMEELCKN